MAVASLSIVAASCAHAAAAQTDVTLELGASQIGPSLGSDASGTSFGVGGIRASHYTPSGSGLAASGFEIHPASRILPMQLTKHCGCRPASSLGKQAMHFSDVPVIGL